MAEETRVLELVQRWEELRDQGEVLSPEALCRDCPELLEGVKRQLARLADLDAHWKSRDTQGEDNSLEGQTPQSSSNVVALNGTPESLPAVEGYEVLEQLGRGGMGVVYKARHLKLGRIVALKMIRSGLSAAPEEQARFRTEAEAVARLQHPHIVQIFEIGEHASQPYLTLEFAEGGNLAQRLRNTLLPLREAAQLVETLARATHAAHQNGIVHRDLKPANVLLTADNTPKITDFGLAKKLDDAGQTLTGAILGTPSYMAPEQAAGKTKEIGPKSDVYALGAILYEMLVGRPPFKAATTLETLQQVLADEPLPPRQLQPKLPRPIQTICLKCLQKEPERRYPSAEALAEDLRRWLNGVPIQAQPAGVLEQFWRWCRRKPAAALLLLVLFGSILTIAIQGYLSHQAVREQYRESLLQQARALSSSRTPGWRERALTAIQQAVAVRPGADLRDAAVQALVTRDFRRRELASGPAGAVAISPDGLEVAAANETAVQCWDLRTGAVLRTLVDHTPDQVFGLQYSPDGAMLACAARGAIHVWNRQSGSLVHRLVPPAPIQALTFGPGPNILSATDGKVLRVWSLHTGKVLCSLSLAEEEKPKDEVSSPEHVTLVAGWKRPFVILARDNRFPVLWQFDGKEFHEREDLPLLVGRNVHLALDGQERHLVLAFNGPPQEIPNGAPMPVKVMPNGAPPPLKEWIGIPEKKIPEPKEKEKEKGSEASRGRKERNLSAGSSPDPLVWTARTSPPEAGFLVAQLPSEKKPQPSNSDDPPPIRPSKPMPMPMPTPMPPPLLPAVPPVALETPLPVMPGGMQRPSSPLGGIGTAGGGPERTSTSAGPSSSTMQGSEAMGRAATDTGDLLSSLLPLERAYVVVYDLTSRRQIDSVSENLGNVRGLCLTNANNLLVAGDSGLVGLYRLVPPSLELVLRRHVESRDLAAASLASDGLCFVTARAGRPPTLWSWEGAEFGDLLHPSAATACQFALDADQRQLAIARWNRGVEIRDLESKQHLGDAPYTRVDALMWSGKASHLAFVDRRMGLHVAQWWKDALRGRVLEAEQVPPFAEEQPNFKIYTVTCSPDNNWLALGGLKPSTVICRNTDEGFRFHTALQPADGEVRNLVFDQRGGVLACATGAGTVRLWSSRDWKLWRELPRGEAEVMTLCFSPDDRLLALGKEDGTVSLWDVQENTEAAALPQGDEVRALCFSPDGRYLVAGTRQGFLSLWDLPSKTRLVQWRGHPTIVLKAEFLSGSDSLLTCCLNGEVVRWRLDRLRDALRELQLDW